MSEKYIARSSAIAARMLGGEMMVMSSVDSTFFTLNEVATAVWQAADGRTPLSEIVTRNVCSEFEVDLEVAQHDAESLWMSFRVTVFCWFPTIPLSHLHCLE